MAYEKEAVAGGVYITKQGQVVNAKGEVLPDYVVTDDGRAVHKDELVTPIPEDFPGADALANAGITTFKQLSEFDLAELTTIPQIGESTANQIRESLGAV